MQEVWKSLEGLVEYGEGYSISNLGRVRDDVRNRIKKISRNGAGYCQTGLKGKIYNVHRLVALAFIPNPENKIQVNHISGDKQDNSVGNLEWVTPSENIRHAYTQGLCKRAKGSKSHLATITEQQATEIKKLLAENYRVMDISRKLGIKKNIVSDINRGVSWNHIEVEGFVPNPSRKGRKRIS
ncbi:hypothetical protein [Bacillus phage SBSphiJ3]|nr:hypothetical protein [Bacillus phage SBSphiJ1]UPI12190.1 hypothetical protein [Bacillus phage SBSphiJ2]UPI12444.1 hypothetical protein [Bacillus phage SBSphiJ3]